MSQAIGAKLNMPTLNDIYATSKKKYGEGTILRASTIAPDFPRIPTGVFAIDLSTAGGIPVGVTSSLWGPPGGAKCLTKGFISTTEGLLPIQDFSSSNELECKDDKFVEKVLTVASDTGKAVSTSHFYEDTVDKTIKLKNRLGIDLEGTPEHRIMLLTSDLEYKMVPLEDVRFGDFSCVCRTNEIFPTENPIIDFIPDSDSYDDSDFLLFDQKFQDIDLILPHRSTPELGRLLGYFVANGYSSGISTTNKKLQEDIVFLSGSLGQNPSIQTTKEGVDVGVYIGASKLSQFIRWAFGTDKTPTARYKTVPKLILRSTKEVQIQFLGGLIDCDSSLNDKNQLEYHTASKELCDTVQIMLLNLGIITLKRSTYLKEYDHTYWGLRFSSGGTEHFLSLYSSIKYADYVPPKKNEYNIDLIPFLKEKLISEIGKLKELFKVTSAGHFHFDDKYCRFKVGHILHTHTDRRMTYPMLHRITEELKDLPQIPEVLSLIDFCNGFFNTNYFYAEITDIEHKNKKTKVYDFHIPDTHLFMSNGYISHNTTLMTRAACGAQTICWNCYDYLWECKCKKTREQQVVIVQNEIFDTGWAKCLGLDLDKCLIIEPDSGEQASDAIVDCLRASDCGLVILDSLAMLVPTIELEASALDVQVASQAKLISKMIRRIKATLIKEKKLKHPVAFLATNQVRSRIGGFGGPTEEIPCGFCSKHDWHLTLRMSQLKSSDIDKETEFPINSKFKASSIAMANKRKLFMLSGSAEFHIVTSDRGDYLKGTINDYKTVLRYAEESGLLIKKNWEFMGVKYEAQQNLLDHWMDNKKFLSAKKKIVDHYVNLAKGSELPPVGEVTPIPTEELSEGMVLTNA